MTLRARIRRLLGRFSLAARITAVIVVVMSIGLTIAGVGTMSVLRDSLVDGVDRDLEGALSTFGGLKLRDAVTPGQCQLEQRVPNIYYLAIQRADGVTLCDNKPDLVGYPQLADVTLERAGIEDSAFTVPSRDGQYQWRVVAAPVAVENTTDYVVLVIGIGLDDVTTTWTAFGVVFTGFAILAVLLGAALTRILAVSTLRGLRRVASTAERFADGEYATRLEPENPRTEVGSLKASLNAMLDRIDTAIEERDASVQQMRQFVGDASHELRTPLVSVRGYAELYRMGALQKPEDVASAMERIEREAKRMGTLVEDLLTLARLDERRPMQLVPVDLVPLVNDAASDARASAKDRQFRVLTIDPDDESVVAASDARPTIVDTAVFAPPPIAPPAVVLADENSMRQVIANLIGNALRYTPECSSIELGVGVSWRRREAHVSVIDHGEGVPKELRTKIFQRFYRTDTSRARETGGSGLGLAIVQGIVRAHGGRIDAVETPGGGATFRIAIPLADDAALLELTRTLRPEQTTTGGSSPQAATAAGHAPSAHA